MDFSHSSSEAATAGLSSSSLGFSERSLSSLASDLTDNHHRGGRMPSHHSMPPTSVGSMSPGINSLKQCRSEMDLEGREDRRGPMKVARTDSYSCRHADLKMHMSTAASPGVSLVRSNSVVSDGRLGCSPTNSCASDGGLLGSDAPAVSDSRQMIRAESVVSAPAYPGTQQGRSPMSYHHQTYHYKPAGSPLSMVREGVGHMSLQNIAGARAPFTTCQWAELEHQALIFKYMMAGVTVPADLLNPIRKDVAALNGISAGSHHINNLPWGTFHLGMASNADPEPGRCRRTDGKKWRCSRDVVPDQKYCERHMHRGRHRSRKVTDVQSANTSPAATTSSSATNSSAVGTLRGGGPLPASGGGASGGGGGGGGGAGGGVGGSSLTHSSLSPTISANSQQQHPNLGMKSFGSAHSNSGSGGGISIGSPGGSNSSGSQFQLPLQSPPGASTMPNKDFRYINGMSNSSTKSELGLGPEQLLFSETSGSARGLGGQDSPSMSNLSRLSSVNHSWQALANKVPPAPQPKAQQQGGNSGNSLLHYSSPQMRSLLGQDFGLMPEAGQVNMPMAQQQHSFLNNGYGGVEAVSVVREPEGQPLRHFFDDWPRSTRDPTTLSWSDVEEERSNNRSNASTTQLSISIPVTSSDFPASNASPSRGKFSFSPLTLSISEAPHRLPSTAAPLPLEPDVALLGSRANNAEKQHRQTTWISAHSEGSSGGELVIRPSAPRASEACKDSGLNLLRDGWDTSQSEGLRMPSPTGVLQKANAFSDSNASSSSSSPLSMKHDPTNLIDRDDRDDDVPASPSPYGRVPTRPWATANRDLREDSGAPIVEPSESK